MSFTLTGGLIVDDEVYEVNIRIQPGLIYNDDEVTVSDYDLDAPFTIIYEDSYSGLEREFDPNNESEEEMRDNFRSDLLEVYYNR